MSLSSHATQENNPWLSWLWANDTAPTVLERQAAEAALMALERRATQCLRQFVQQTPELATYQAWQDSMENLSAFFSWAQSLLPYSARRHRRPLQSLLDKAEVRQRRRWERHLRPETRYQKHLAKLERHLRRLGETVWADFVASERGMDGTSVSASHLQQEHALKKQIQRRRSRISDQLVRTGGVHLLTWPAPSNPALEAESRAVAAARGLAGYIALPHTDVERFLLFNCHDEAIRVQLWEGRQAIGLKTEDIETLRNLRQSEAEVFGYTDRAHMALANALVATPQRAERHLGQALNSLRRPFQRAIATGAEKARLDASGNAPWNFRYSLQQAHGQRVPTMPNQAFPWRQTVLKAIPELLALGGWSCLASPSVYGRGVQRLLRFRLRHTDGRRAQLLYAPFNPQPQLGVQTGAQCGCIRSTLQHAPETEAVIFLEHFLDPQTEQRGLGLEEIDYLCHEMGHALHYLALPGRTHAESVSLPTDLYEIPSILLEIYAHQPETLIRWLGSKAPKSLRKPSYWAQRLRSTMLNVAGFHRRMYRPYVDLRLARRHTGSLQQVLDEADARGGFVRHPKQVEELDFFDTDEGATEFGHIVGMAMAMRLYPIYEHGQVQSAGVAARFQTLLHDVLSIGNDRRAIQRAWRKMTGEGMADSLKLGMQAMVRRECRILRKAYRSD